LFSEAASREMWTPVTPMPIGNPPAPIEGTKPQFLAYALGWEVQDYHGHKIIWHSGGLFGFTSIVVLIPEKNVGFAIELNAEEIEPRFGLMYELLDHYLGLPKQDWPAKFGAYRRTRIADAQAAIRQKAATPAGVGPSLALDRYAGTFSDPWYGQVVIGKDAKGLTVDFMRLFLPDAVLPTATSASQSRTSRVRRQDGSVLGFVPPPRSSFPRRRAPTRLRARAGARR